MWVDGWPDIYTKWGVSEPSSDDCVVMTSADTWDAVPCTGSCGYVCKTTTGMIYSSVFQLFGIKLY